MFTNYKDRTCSLECKEGEVHDPVHEFIGPVKMIFIDPTRFDFWYKKCTPAIFTLAYFLLILTVVSIVLCTITFKFSMETNVHIFLCTLGFNLLLPTGILMLDPMFGPGANLEQKKKYIQHVVLQFFATLYIFAGVGHLWQFRKLSVASHGIIGQMAMFFVLMSVILGGFTLLPKWSNFIGIDHGRMMTMHKVGGMLTLTLSIVTFGTGLFKPSFKEWCYAARLVEWPYLLLVFSIIYTICIITSVFFRTFIYVNRS